MIASLAPYAKAPVLIVGAGPAGLAAAITLKCRRPAASVLVLDKAAGPGEHNLSGAVMDPRPLQQLLDLALPAWREDNTAKTLLGRRVTRDEVLMFLGRDHAVSMMPAIKAAGVLHLAAGQMLHHGDVILSISQLTTWLSKIASNVGVEVLYGFSVEDLVCEPSGRPVGVKLKDQGLNRHGARQPNYAPGETISADIILLAEGCHGLVSEQFIRRANLLRSCPQLYSVGIKEILRVSPQQYQDFGDGRVVHAMGYPLWKPLAGPGMFGGGFMYALGDNTIAAGVIVAADWKYRDFVPQDALSRFKEHRFVRRFLEGAKVVEAGAKMIPEGGLRALPRDPGTGAIGRHNVLLLGDSAGFVNMLKIKGLHNAISSGIAAGQAAADCLDTPSKAAVRYTRNLESLGVIREMHSARNFRQTVAALGNSLGLPLSALGGRLPGFKGHPDGRSMTRSRYCWRLEKDFDKNSFTASARVQHREDQPCHCEVLDPVICDTTCAAAFDRPCMHECVFTDRNQQASGVTTLEMAKRLIDHGYHPPTIYFPLVVHGAIMIEPTETETKEELDGFIEAIRSIVREAGENPQALREAPSRTKVKRLDETAAARNPCLAG